MAMHILTDITLQFHNATTGWNSYLFPIANHLFSALAIIEIAWAGIWWALEKTDTHSLWVEMLKRFVSIGIFYTILLNSNSWIPAVISSFMQIGQGASGHTNLYPSDVMDQGISIASNIFDTFHNQGIFSFGLPTIVGACAGLMVLLSFALIAGLLVVALVESYIVLGAGVLMLGFASNRMSLRFANNVLSYAMGVGTKLFMLYLVLGIGGNLAAGWIGEFKSLSSTHIVPFLEVMGGSFVYLFVAWAIPNKAEALASGATHATLGGLIASATTAKSAANLATAPARTVAGGGASGIEAIKQIQAIKAGSNGEQAGFAKAGMIAGANLAMSTVGSWVGHHPSAHGAMKQKTADMKEGIANRREEKVLENHARPEKVSPPAQPA